jgi:hypothetical protein
MSLPFQSLPSRRAGRAVNPRGSAVPGSATRLAGGRAAGDMPPSSFIAQYVPVLWNAVAGQFGVTATYWPADDSAAAIDIVLVWTSGVEGEQRFPGRYSHALVRDADFPAGLPQEGDAITAQGVEYDVVNVHSLVTGESRLVLHNRMDVSFS